MDSAFGLESAIPAPRLCDSHSRLISARGLQSPDSISKILESCGLLRNLLFSLSRQYLPMILWVVERKARAHTWSYVTAGLRDDSRKGAAKTTRSPYSLELSSPITAKSWLLNGLKLPLSSANRPLAIASSRSTPHTTLRPASSVSSM